MASAGPDASLIATQPEETGPPWLPLLRRLSDVSPHWVVWKNVDSALSGTGDIDAAAPPTDWPVITDEFRRWAATYALGPVVVCRHIPGGLNLIAVPPRMPTFLEIGVKARKVWRGATLFVLDDLKPLMIEDERGFRRLRLGAEGLFKFVLNGTRRGGRPDWDALRAKHVLEQIRDDPAGTRAAARLFGTVEDSLVKATERAVAGEWDRTAMLKVEAWALAKALGAPRVLLDRLRFRAVSSATCPVVATLLTRRRRIPDDREAWMRLVATTHSVYDGHA